jgi:hypothetical protein
VWLSLLWLLPASVCHIHSLQLHAVYMACALSSVMYQNGWGWL